MYRYIFCLGNPGKKYAYTRHNIGFLIADSIASVLGKEFVYNEPAHCQVLTYQEDIPVCNHDTPRNRDVSDNPVSSPELTPSKIIIVKPLGFMNNSGDCVAYFLKKKAIHNVSEIVVVTDNFDLDVGILRFRTRGSRSPKHNGIRSISMALQSNEYARLYCGIGNPPVKHAIPDYVLSSWDDEDDMYYQEMCASATKAILSCFLGTVSNLTNVIATHNQNIKKIHARHYDD